MDDFTKVVTASGYVGFTCESDDPAKNGKHFVMDPDIALAFARRLAVMAREAGATNISEDFQGVSEEELDAELFHP
jgi:hypothetical protein